LYIKLVNCWDKYTEMHGQQTVKSLFTLSVYLCFLSLSQENNRYLCFISFSQQTTTIYVSYQSRKKQPLFMFPIILAINNHYLCFLSFSQETTTIFVYNINYFIFIMEIECVYCAVRTGTSNTFHTEWSIQSVTLCMLWSDG